MSGQKPSITSIPAKYMNELAKGITRLNNRIEDDVSEMCREVLKPFREDYKTKIEPVSAERQERCLKDILRSLKIHLNFHCGVAESSRTETGIEMNTERETSCYGEIANLEFGLGPISNQEEGRILKFVIDPGSLLLEMFSIYTLAEKPDDVEGSEAHAKRVFELANVWFKKLDIKNTFKPKVLAKISQPGNNKHSIGSSIAVSHFLRPICLYNRIIRLKRTLAKTILHFEPLKLVKDEWVFEAFQHKSGDDGYRSKKDTCKNCKMIFFGDHWGEGHSTFLGACAEYCAVNELLPAEGTSQDNVDEKDSPLLKRNLSRCSLLFEGFKDISEKCIYVCKQKNCDENSLKELYWKVIYKLHIFGLKPECNPCF